MPTLNSEVKIFKVPSLGNLKECPPFVLEESQVYFENGLPIRCKLTPGIQDSTILSYFMELQVSQVKYLAPMYNGYEYHVEFRVQDQTLEIIPILTQSS